MDHVDILFETVRDVAVPYRNREQVTVRIDEAVRGRGDLVPGGPLPPVLLAARDHRYLGRDLVSVEVRDALLHQIERIGGEVRQRRARRGQIGLGDGVAFGNGSARP